MAAPTCPLRDEQIRPCFERLACDGEALHLADELRAAGADPVGEGARIAEGKHHCARLVAERKVEQLRLLREAPGDEAHANRGARGLLELAPDPVGVAVAATHEAETARVRYRGGERAAGNEAHRCEHDGLFGAQHVRVHALRPALSFSFWALIMARVRSQSASERLSSSVK